MLALVALALTDQLQSWHVYLAAAVSASFSTFQGPAAMAAVAQLVPREQLGRANGMLQLAGATGQIITPLLAGVLLVALKLPGILLIDFISFLVAVGTLLLVRFPPMEAHSAEPAERRPWLREASYGLTYLLRHAGLGGLLVIFAISNFLLGSAGVLFTPLVLSFTSPETLGFIIAVGGFGMLAGSLALSISGGPKRRVYGVLGFVLMGGICTLLAGLNRSVALVAVAAFGFFFALPIANGCTTAIWQSKIPSSIQGRVFALSGMVAGLLRPVGFLTAGLLADAVFEPLLAANGPLAGSIGQLIGVGPGRGIAFLFIIAGLLTSATAAAGFLYPRVLRVENELPDAETAGAQNVQTLRPTLAEEV
jgi:MFS family permease